MTQQYLAGLHPIFGMGVYLSRPGVGVTTATNAADYLLRPDLKNEQVVLSGQVFIPLGGSPVTVAYPATLSKTPYVFFKEYTSPGAAAYPYDLNMAASNVTIGGVLLYEVVIGISIYNNQIVFSNPSENYSLYVDYMVFNRSIGF